MKEKHKRNIEVLSAGIGDIEGLSPTEETINVMTEKGAFVSDHSSNAATSHLIRRADLVLVMQNHHKKEIIRRVPEAKDKVYLLREYTQEAAPGDTYGLEIEDPIGKSIGIYRRIADVISKSIEKLMEII